MSVRRNFFYTHYMRFIREHPIATMIIRHGLDISGTIGFPALAMVAGAFVINGTIPPPFMPRMEQGLLIIMMGAWMLIWRTRRE
jgi:hypothetical protein